MREIDKIEQILISARIGYVRSKDSMEHIITCYEIKNSSHDNQTYLKDFCTITCPVGKSERNEDSYLMLTGLTLDGYAMQGHQLTELSCMDVLNIIRAYNDNEQSNYYDDEW